MGKWLKVLVPAEGIEPPTNGLQNRCSTAELSRLARSRAMIGPLRIRRLISQERASRQLLVAASRDVV